MSSLLLVVALVAVVLIVGQVVIPRIGEQRLERRLAERGGDAFVVLEALPATRLLRKRGGRISVRGRRLALGLSKQGGGLGALDGFDEVDIVLTDFVAGPFQVERFELNRSGAGPYLMRSQAKTNGAELVEFGSDALGMAGRSLLGALARQAPLGGRNFPVSVEVLLNSDDGLLTVSGGDGTIAGYPAGPIAPLIAGAVARQLVIRH